MIDGRIFDETGREVFELSGIELDGFITELYPDLNSMADIRKKQTSWSGWRWSNFDSIPDGAVDWQEAGTCEVAMAVYQHGGTRLLTLYCNKMDFFSAAQDLKLSHWTLRKWFERWKRKAIAQGICPADLGMEPIGL